LSLRSIHTFFGCSLLAAFTQSNAATHLDDVVVTGTRTERKLLDVPVRTEVVSKQELKKTHARDLAEALRHQPGLLLKETHGKSGSQVWLQGLDSDRVLVLLNGRPVSASTGSTVDLSQLAVGHIDHIEIVKGAVSALYGSSAMGGVVNIITRPSKEALAYTFVADAGSFGDKNLGSDSDLSARHGFFDLSANSKKWRGYIAADFRDTDGFDLDKSTYVFEGDEGLKYNINSELSWRWSEDGAISLNPSFYREDLSRGFSSFAPGVGEIKKLKLEEAERFNTTLSIKDKFANGAALNAYFIHEIFDDVTAQDTLASAELDQRRQANFVLDKAEIQWDHPIGDEQLWTLGLVGFQADLSQHQNRLEGSDILHIDEITEGANRTNIEFFVQDDIFLNDRWEILPGFRFQDDSDFGRHTAPKINAMFTPNWWPKLNTSLRFGIGKGYRVPNLKERFFIFDHSGLGYMVLGTPNLGPEESDSYQVGFEVSNQRGARAELSVFYNDIEDLIDTDLDPVESQRLGLSIFRYGNFARARTRGGDIVVSYPLSDTFSSDIGYSYLHAEDRITGKDLVRRPEHQIKLGLDWKIPQWKNEFSLRATYQSDEFIDSENTLVSPGWTRVDFKFNQSLSNGLTFFVGIDNMTDEHRDPSRAGRDFRPKKGRFIYLGLRLEGSVANFNKNKSLV